MGNFDFKFMIIKEIRKFSTNSEYKEGIIDYFIISDIFKTIGNINISDDDVTRTYKKNDNGDITITLNTKKDIIENGKEISLEATIATIVQSGDLIIVTIEYNGKKSVTVIGKDSITNTLTYFNEDIDCITEAKSVSFSEKDEPYKYTSKIDVNEKHMYEGTLTDIHNIINGRAMFDFSSPDKLKSHSFLKGDIVGANYNSHVGVFTNNIFVRLDNELASRYAKKISKNRK